MSGSGDKKRQHQAPRGSYTLKGSPQGPQNTFHVHHNDFSSSSFAQQGTTNTFYDNSIQNRAPITPRQSVEEVNRASQSANQATHTPPNHRCDDQATQKSHRTQQASWAEPNGSVARDPLTPPGRPTYEAGSNPSACEEQYVGGASQCDEKPDGTFIPQIANITMYGSSSWHGLIATLDTGTKLNWISAAIVQRLGLEPEGGIELEFETFNGQHLNSSATLDITWAILGGTISSVTNFRVVQDPPFDVLFGWNYLNKHRDKFEGTASPTAVLAQKKVKKDEEKTIEENRKQAQGESSELSNARNHAKSSESRDKKGSHENRRKRDKGKK